jgi:hypothetical protein
LLSRNPSVARHPLHGDLQIGRGEHPFVHPPKSLDTEQVALPEPIRGAMEIPVGVAVGPELVLPVLAHLSEAAPPPHEEEGRRERRGGERQAGFIFSAIKKR